MFCYAAGLSDGLHLGHNARATLITRGLAELMELTRQLGGSPVTLFGLSGLGDVLLTCTGDLSRNRQVGLQLASGAALDAILARLGHVAEGVYAAQAVVQLADHYGCAMPYAVRMGCAGWSDEPASSRRSFVITYT